MNPPYDGNLHLKLLEIAKEYTNETCINLSPVRWFLDPLAYYKKSSDYKRFEKSIRYYIKDLELITVTQAQVSFNARIPVDLGIYTITNNKLENPYENKTFAFRIAGFLANGNKCPIEYNKKDGWRVRLPNVTCSVAGYNKFKEITLSVLKCYDGLHDEKPWYTFYSRNQNTKETPEITCSIHFDSESECDNFIESLNLDIARYYMQKAIISIDYLNPLQVFWLGNLTNPRTGLIGYKSDWTNKDINDIFMLSDAEKYEMLETLKPTQSTFTCLKIM